MKAFYQSGIPGDYAWYPEYPELGATVAKFRRVANEVGSIRSMARADVVAYAEAIEKAIRAKHRTLHMRPTPLMNTPKYSPPSITRLLHYDQPLKMVGDPDWIPKCKCPRYGKCTCNHWAPREEAVYAAMMEEKAKRKERRLQAAE
jgi:hypothetical protein